MSQTKKFDIHSLWLFLLFFSFFYELPLVTISFDRLNPRLLDLCFVVGVFLNFHQLVRPVHNPVFSWWRRIVIWFVICSLFSVVFLLPKEVRLYSLLAAFRYVESLIIIKIVLSISVDKRHLFYAAFLGLIVDSVYCYFQRGQTTVRELSPGNYVVVDFLTGPLSSSYFEISQLLPFAAIVLLSILEMLYSPGIKRSLLQCLVVVLCWPLLYTGSRTGLFLCGVSLLLYVIISKQRNYFLIVLALCCGFFYFNRFDEESSELYTVTRTLRLEKENNNDIEKRIEIIRIFDLDNYDNAKALPFIGAGFNVAPINHYNRIDYGIHSMFLYPLEQAGIIGFALFISFLICCFRTFYKRRRIDSFCMGMLAYLVSMMLIGIGGHNFWREFSSGNINTFIVLSYCLAYKFAEE